MERYVNNYYPTVDQMAIDGGVVGVNDVHMDRWTPFVLRSDYDALHKQLTDAQATIAALQAERDEYKTMYACLTGETYDNPIADLKAQLTQRTAELEAAKQWKLQLCNLTPGGSEFADDPAYCAEWVRKSRENQHNVILDKYREAKALKAELERVRGQYADLRKMVLALPKVEGEIETWDHDNGLMFTCLTRPVSRYAITFRSSEERDAYAALLQYRQGMEG